jgi:hypothetical protein
VVIVPGAELAAIPARVVLSAVAVTEAALNLGVGGSELDVNWATDVAGVYYTPRKAGAEPAARGVREQGASCDATFLDLYIAVERSLKRFTALPDATAFSGFGEAAPLSPAGRVAHLMQVCGERFTSGQFDHRLVNMQVRHWPPPAPSPKLVVRKGLSFASTGLAELLGRLGPELVNISHCEIASRLAYLTLRFAERP